ncbi:Aste57867_18991 [Aphanomyces stellatus]|uniref:Aste57867_18991 protein n=1 Tax=Aphanomyces stellatus TaxID=120398 RepID=A0A485LD67_9STRA|nr:hypothetical protein As57867_018927 [Aphanomyces stellatus]VFT95717.1 Aste57867_18991 [Aphanomyces stellatus]
MTTPIAGILDLQARLQKLAPTLALQPMPKLALPTAKHGVKATHAIRGQDLLLALCATDEQRECVVELVEKHTPPTPEGDDEEAELSFTGAFDSKTNTFSLTKAVFLNERQQLVHRFVELMELQLEDPESATEVLELLLTENGHSAKDVHIAEECLTVAYALQTLLRAFPSIPLTIQGQEIAIDDTTDVVEVFGPLFAPKKAKKNADKKAAAPQKKRKQRS